MEIILCDDNAGAMATMERYIMQYGKKNNRTFTLVKYSSGQDLLQTYVWKPKQLIFMDMKMDSLNGNEVVQLLRERTSREPQVIFVSGHHQEFWQYGYKLHAFHFLTKPIEKAEVFNVLDDFILNKLKEPAKINYFQFRRSGSPNWEVVNEQHIEYFEKTRKANSILMVTEKEEVVLYETIKSVSDRLSDDFVQCHKTYIVNVRQIKRRQKDLFILKIQHEPGQDRAVFIGKAYSSEAVRRYVAFNRNYNFSESLDD